jgi:hypothetical protein
VEEQLQLQSCARASQLARQAATSSTGTYAAKMQMLKSKVWGAFGMQQDRFNADKFDLDNGNSKPKRGNSKPV